MNDRELFRLMQLIPEEYAEETAAFLAAHGKTADSGQTAAAVRQKKPEPQSGIIRRFLLPAGAAACLAALIITGIRTGLREQPLTEASSAPEMTLIAAQTGTTPAETALTEAAVQRTETVTQTPAQNGTAPPVQSTASAVTAAEEHQPETASRNQDTTAKPQTAAAPMQQTAPETPADSVPAQDTDYLPGDVNMDGEVDLYDAMLITMEYQNVVIWGKESILTPQQVALGDVYPNTAADDLEQLPFRLREDYYNNAEIPIMATDYPIGFQDVQLMWDYYTTMIVGLYRLTLGDMTVPEYAQYLGLLPTNPEKYFAGETVTMQGDTLPEDFVTIPDFGDYPVNPADWTMLRAKLTEHENFVLWYKGTNALADCRIIITGSIEDTEYLKEHYENIAENGTKKKLTVGDTAVYYNAKEISYYWDNPYTGYPSIVWFSGKYKITVYTQKQYPDDVIQQIAESFAGYPAN